MAELAYATDAWVPVRRDAGCASLGYRVPHPRAERMEVFVQAYGLPADRRPDLAVALVANAQDRMAFGMRMHETGREPSASWWAADKGAVDREDLRVTEEVADEWLRPFGSI
jgi:hypothetical protein